MIPGGKYIQCSVKMNEQTELYWKWIGQINKCLYKFNMLPWGF